MFGACRRTVSSAAGTNAATPAADSDTIGDEAAISADCGDGDADSWRAIPATPSKVARVAAPAFPVVATASIRFGMRIPSTQAAGAYRAPITFTVVAPEV